MTVKFKIAIGLVIATLLLMGVGTHQSVSNAAGRGDTPYIPETTTVQPTTTTTVAPPPTAPPAAPGCGTWATQEESQAWFDANAGSHDTSNIDTDGDGKPCTAYFAPPTTQAPAVTAPAVTETPEVPAASSSGANWDALAQCEAGGNWAHPPVGSYGYSGGLMFLPSTWRSYGGTEFAPQAYQASRSQQIVVAERILADVSRSAWPGCSSAGKW
jgi:hypothetical protein